MRTKFTLFTVSLAALLLTGAAAAQPVDAPPPAPPAAAQRLIVGTKPVPPFVVKNPDGSWGGISVALWREVADALKLDYDIREYPLDQLLKGGEHGEIDVLISLNITAEREETMDLTHAFFSTGLAIAVSAEDGPSAMETAGKILTPSFLGTIGAVFGVLVLLGFVMWLFERRDNPDEFEGAGGLLNGVFWAIETVIGYNDPQHKTRRGRFLGIAWAFFGVFLIAGLTARISAELTVDQLSSTVSGPGDLPRVKVGTVEKSAGARYCDRRGLSCKVYPDASAALGGIVNGEVTAVVYEAPVLQYVGRTTYPDLVKVLPGTFENHGYGLGLKKDSPLRKPVNVALLRFAASDAWRELLVGYLGPQ